jgi:hypothetical protein
MGVNMCLTPRSGRFTPLKETWYILYRRLNGPQGRFRRVQKLSLPPEFDPQTVQPVVIRYTDNSVPKRKLAESLVIKETRCFRSGGSSTRSLWVTEPL